MDRACNRDRLPDEMAEPGMKPEAVFKLVSGEKVVTVYKYCNLHGLWMAEA